MARRRLVGTGLSSRGPCVLRPLIEEHGSPGASVACRRPPFLGTHRDPHVPGRIPEESTGPDPGSEGPPEPGSLSSQTTVGALRCFRRGTTMTLSGSHRHSGHGLHEDDLRLVVRGHVPDARSVEYARAKVLAAARATRRPVNFVRLTLALEARPANSPPARAEVLMDINGRTILAHAQGRSIRQAVDRLEQRLRRRIVTRVSGRARRAADRRRVDR